jgi:hypothetical protein
LRLDSRFWMSATSIWTVLRPDSSHFKAFETLDSATGGDYFLAFGVEVAGECFTQAGGGP